LTAPWSSRQKSAWRLPLVVAVRGSMKCDASAGIAMVSGDELDDPVGQIPFTIIVLV